MAQTQVAIAGLRSAQFAGGQVRVARGYDAWFDAGWGRYAWRAESAGVFGVHADPAMLAVAATRAPERLIRADAAHLPLPDATADAAVALATLEFAADPARVLAEMARVTRPGGGLVVAVLNPRSPWGWAGRVRHRAPYRDGWLRPRQRLCTLGRRHGLAAVRGVLFALKRLPALRVCGPVLEAAGRVAPRFGALQILTVYRGQST